MQTGSSSSFIPPAAASVLKIDGTALVALGIGDFPGAEHRLGGVTQGCGGRLRQRLAGAHDPQQAEKDEASHNGNPMNVAAKS